MGMILPPVGGLRPAVTGEGSFSEVSYLNITSDQQLVEYCSHLARAPWIAFDTEFVAEQSYRPLLCLLQVATADSLAIVDALTIRDMNPFWQVLAEGEHETIVHAGRGEMEFCLRAVNRWPARLFDVQIAAGLVGIEYPAGFRTLIYKLLGESTRKEETRTDWHRRPLSPRQIDYALDDVRYLPLLYEKLRSRLAELRRTDWLIEEMAAFEREVEQAFSVERWRRVSGNSGLDRRSLAIVRELWRWRESEAERRNCPVRRVLRDDLLVELAKRQTADLKRIKSVRGLERGDLTRQLPKIAARIKHALDLPLDECPSTAHHEPTPQLAVLGQFLFSALGSICRQQNLAPGLVGTPNDIRELIAVRLGYLSARHAPRLAHGWRAEVIGQVIHDLLEGRLAMRVEDPRSDHPLVIEPLPPRTGT